MLLQPFRSNKYDSLKAILIERRGLTTPERVNKVISGEKIGNDIPSRFLRRLQKTAGFGTKAVVGKAVIRQAFIRQMPASIRAHLVIQPDSATLESLAVLADRALVAEEDVEESEQITMLTRLHLPLMFRPQVLLATNLVSIETQNIMLHLSFRRRMHRPLSLFMNQIIVLMHNKMFDLSHRRRKIMSHNRPTQPLHRFAITTTLMVKRRACAVNPVHTMSH